MNSFAIEQESFAIGQESESISRSRKESVEKFVGNSIYALSIYENHAHENFLVWKKMWEENTSHLSSVSAIVEDMAYQEIVSLGPIIVPFIIEDLKKKSNHWFYALSSLTNENPILPEHAGDVEQMKNDWINWWDTHNAK